MANLLATTHVREGEHVELVTASGSLRVHGVLADDRVLLGTSLLGVGQHEELRGPAGPLPVIAVASLVAGVVLLASSNVGDDQAVEVNTAAGTLGLRGYDPRELPPPTEP